jgi:RNA polymerase sigma factor (sigma-70 family)
MPTHPDDLARARRVAGGDEEAVEEFVREYGDWLAAQARRCRVPAQDCEDIVQNSLLAALDQLRRGLYRGDSSLRTWVAAIARGKAADYFAGRAALATLVPFDADEGWRADGQRPLAEVVAGPPADYETILGVRAALAAMPVTHRLVLLLNRTEGYTIEQISQAWEKSKSWVARRLYEAEEMFARLICGDDLRPPLPRLEIAPPLRRQAAARRHEGVLTGSLTEG